MSCMVKVCVPVFDSMKLLVYLCTRRIACAGPCGGSLRRAVWALGRQSSAAVRVAEALAVLFADLREQTAECLPTVRCWLYIRLSQDLEASGVCSLNQHVALGIVGERSAQTHGRFTLRERNDSSFSAADDEKLTFFCRRQWKMKMNIPWKVLNMVKRYAMTIEASLMKKRPKDQVRPSRNSKAKAPMTQDLKGGKRRKQKQKREDESSMRGI